MVSIELGGAADGDGVTGDGSKREASGPRSEFAGAGKATASGPTGDSGGGLFDVRLCSCGGGVGSCGGGVGSCEGGLGSCGGGLGSCGGGVGGGVGSCGGGVGSCGELTSCGGGLGSLDELTDISCSECPGSVNKSASSGNSSTISSTSDFTS